MPNQRDANKDLIGAYIPKDLKDKVLDVAKSSGKTVSQFLEESLQQGVAKYPILCSPARPQSPATGDKPAQTPPPKTKKGGLLKFLRLRKSARTPLSKDESKKLDDIRKKWLEEQAQLPKAEDKK